MEDYAFLVNKDHTLDRNYVPSDLVLVTEYNGQKIDPSQKTLVRKEAFLAFYEMQSEAKKLGYHIIIDSGFRSYEYQEKILTYNYNLLKDKAFELVALPGTSEHQSGLAIDVALYKNNEYTDKFTDKDEEIIWLFNNAFRFGFILRYPENTREITGFAYEYWHFRYVGKEVSKYMHDNDILTLEDYHQKLTPKR